MSNLQAQRVHEAQDAADEVKPILEEHRDAVDDPHSGEQPVFRTDIPDDVKIYETRDINLYGDGTPIDGPEGLRHVLTGTLHSALAEAVRDLARSRAHKVTLEALVAFEYSEGGGKKLLACVSPPDLARPSDSPSDTEAIVDRAIEAVVEAAFRQSQSYINSPLVAEKVVQLRVSGYLYRAYAAGAGDYTHTGCISPHGHAKDPLWDQYWGMCGVFSILHQLHWRDPRHEGKNHGKMRPYCRYLPNDMIHLPHLKPCELKDFHEEPAKLDMSAFTRAGREPGLFMSVDDIPWLEEANQFRIHVQGYYPWNAPRDSLVPIYTSKRPRVQGEPELDLMLAFDKDTRKPMHWLSINKFSACIKQHLVEPDLDGEEKEKGAGEKLVCRNCLRRFCGKSTALYNSHVEACTVINPSGQLVRGPKPGAFSFKHPERRVKPRWVAHLSFDLRVDAKTGVEVPGAAAICLVDDLDVFQPPVAYNTLSGALDALFVLHEAKFLELHGAVVPMLPLTPEQKRAHKATLACPWCECTLVGGMTRNEAKVADHDHRTGQYRGVLCKRCNVGLTDRRFRLTVYVADFQARSPHFLAAMHDLQQRKIKVIPGDGSPGRVKVLRVDNGKPPERREQDDGARWVARKSPVYSGVDFCSTDTYFAPPHLGDEDPPTPEVAVVGLARKMVRVRNLLMDKFVLDPAHFHTGVPAYGMKAMLHHSWRKTGAKSPIELCVDPEMYAFAERAKRGGTCCANVRHVTEVPESNTRLFGLDVTSLYPAQMRRPLPCGNYRWVDPSELPTTREQVLDLDGDGPTGMLLTVDGHFPPELHASLSDFPPMPERRVVKREELSPHSQGVAPAGFVKARSQLLMHLWPKTDYTIELRHLQVCLRLGFVLTRVRKALAYDQRPWLRDFVDEVVAMRQGAATEEDARLCKLVMNSLSGKLQTDVRKHVDVAVRGRVSVDDFSSPRFKGVHTVYGDLNRPAEVGLHIVTKAKDSVELDAPIVAGVVMLELAKAHNLGLWYEGIRPRWPDARLIYHDTDSAVVLVHGGEGEDVVEELKKLRCIDGAGSKEPGLFKIEAPRIVEMVCLGKKCYSYKLPDGSSKAGAAGMTTKPSHGEYEERLWTGSKAIAVRVARMGHTEGGDAVLTQVAEERLLAGNTDASRWWLEGGMDSLALGYLG
jgi:Recombination endonuclease VII